MRAPDGMTFTVEPGSVTGFLGRERRQHPALDPRLLPPTAVLAMPTLYAIEAAPSWAVVLSMALTAVSVVLVAGVAAKIYERSVMHTARKIGWREAFRARQEIEPATAGR